MERRTDTKMDMPQNRMQTTTNRKKEIQKHISNNCETKTITKQGKKQKNPKKKKRTRKNHKPYNGKTSTK